MEVVSGSGAARVTDQTWLGRFFSSAGVQVRVAQTAGKPDVLPPIYWRGMERRTPESGEDGWRSRVQQAQYTPPPGAAVPPARGRACSCRLTNSPAAGPPALRVHSGRQRSGALSRRAADSRLSPQRRARPIPVVSIQSQQQPVDRGHRFRGERHRRRTQRRERHLGHFDRSAGDLDHGPAGAGPYGTDDPGPAGADGVLHGGPHRIPPGRADHLRQPHVLRRAQPRGHGDLRRHADAGPHLRRVAAAARRRVAADRPRPFCRSERLPYVEPHRRANAIGSRPATCTSRTSSGRRSTR